MDYELVIKTDGKGRPYVGAHTGALPPDATFTVSGREPEADGEEPFTRLIVVNDVIIDTGAAVPQRAR